MQKNYSSSTYFPLGSSAASDPNLRLLLAYISLLITTVAQILLDFADKLVGLLKMGINYYVDLRSVEHIVMRQPVELTNELHVCE